MSSAYLLFLVLGRILIYIGNKFVQQNDIKIKFINRLFSCSLCLGVWVYTFMSITMQYYVFDDLAPYIPILSELMAGCFSSLVVYYFENGWKAIHETIVI